MFIFLNEPFLHLRMLNFIEKPLPPKQRQMQKL
jgi:hypothetical protein